MAFLSIHGQLLWIVMVDILKFFVPREEKFFDMMKNQAENILKGAEKFNSFVNDFEKLDSSERVQRVKEIKEIEHDGDKITHYIIETLNKTFITPIDREDIHQTIVNMDDILDMIYTTSNKINLYKISRIDDYIIKFSEIILKCTEEIHSMVMNLKYAKNMHELFIKLHTLENEADDLHNIAISNLFDNGTKEIDIIKLKDIYDFLEDIVDTAEDLANVMEGIVVKHA